VQGSAGEIQLQALTLVKERLARYEGARIVNAVHDEIVVIAREKDADKVAELLQDCMIRTFLDMFPGAPPSPYSPLSLPPSVIPAFAGMTIKEGNDVVDKMNIFLFPSVLLQKKVLWWQRHSPLYPFFNRTVCRTRREYGTLYPIENTALWP